MLGEIAHGYANPEIARRLYLSEAAVQTHVGRILAKLGLRDRVYVVIFAYDHGLVRPASGSSRGRTTTILRSDALQRLYEHAGDTGKRLPAKGKSLWSPRALAARIDPNRPNPIRTSKFR